MEIIAVGLFFTDSDALTVLPDVASFASDAMRTIINLAIDATNAVKDPVILFVFKFL